MDTRQQLDSAAASRKQDLLLAAERYGEQSRNRLSKIIATKHRTTLIGAISRFEEHFGKHLWGHGVPDNEKSPTQLKWNKIWQACRTAILNHGNAQLRAIEKEIQQYDIEWLRYQTDIQIANPIA